MTSRRRFVGSLAAIPVLASLGPNRAIAAPGRAGQDELLLMTYNLRYAGDRKPNAWRDRRPVMKALFDAYAPDICGTQEGLYPQLRDIAADQPGYDWIGTGRDGGSRGEFMAVFYRRDRFEPLEFDHFWLSDTPDVVGSATWGNTNRRMVTWVRFQDRRTRREFHVWNTHLDHQVQGAREKAALLIRERIAKIREELPLFLLGDFNAQAAGNPAYDILVKEGGLTDTWFAAKERRNEDVDSFNNFGPVARQGRRIDWILARARAEIRATEIVTFRQGGQWPSDHCPVAAWLTLR
ncbi:MAG: endonuclease/exonuclease/phosphatase family protein [Verrucomicrobia bacterium]|nr:MAG: endonuclease/exonuclease/phosphatase family protein [Verrucomicrobiota bacterium]